MDIIDQRLVFVQNVGFVHGLDELVEEANEGGPEGMRTLGFRDKRIVGDILLCTSANQLLSCCSPNIPLEIPLADRQFFYRCYQRR